jgi:hypothetical protein
MKLFSKISILTLLLISCGSNHILKEVKIFEHYPSASGLEYFNKQVFVIGDDAKYVLILDSNLVPIDSISLYEFPGNKIPKDIKPDLESMTIVRDDNGLKLFLPGSGSKSPNRDIGWLIDPVTKQKDSIRLDTFYRRIKASGLEELNIEGVCSIPGSVVFSNRGSKGYPKNHLVFTSEKFWKKQSRSPVKLIRVGANTDSAIFNGVSGLAYASKSDRLLLTVSTEDTKNSIDDGAIGKSYLWIITNISSKKGMKGINPNQVIDLEKTDSRFKGQKIESVCITKETKHFLHLVLAADNDNGSSTLFRLIVEKD